MSFLSLLGGKKKASPKQIRSLLPSQHAFIECIIHGGPKGSVCFEAAGPKSFVVTTMSGLTTGSKATFVYATGTGKYKFSSPCLSTTAAQATFALPERIETVEKFSAGRQRTTLRVDTTLAVQWRFAPTGKITPGEFQRGSLTDISRTGASLSTERELKIGTALEVKIPLSNTAPPVVLRAEVRRVDAIGSGKHSTGVRYVGLSTENDRAILDFINRRQADLRNRGLA